MSTRKKSIVLLSGGLDSSVNLFAAHRETQVLKALTFDYGQRAVEKEISSARQQCELLKIPHEVIDLRWLAAITNTSLVNRNQDVPVDVEIDNSAQTKNTAKAVWVPNRNGIFLNIGAAYAESLGADFVIPGFNREEAQTFPDNSEEFLDAMTESLSYSTANQTVAFCYTAKMDKPEIARFGKKLGVNFDLVWACYFGDERPCGKCESCLRFKRAMSAV